MRIQKRYWFGLLGLAFVGLAVFLSLPPKEPIVNGHSLGYWLDDPYFGNSFESSAEIRKAFSQIDDDCIAWLIDQLEWKPSRGLRKTEELSGKWLHVYLHAEPRDRRVQAALLLAQFGSRASNAIPALENMSRFYSSSQKEFSYVGRGTALAALILIRPDSMEACARKSIDPNEPRKQDYVYAMGCLGTNAALCVPIFVAAIRAATNEDVTVSAVWGLAQIHSCPELSLPVLTSMLNETNEDHRYRAVSALSSFASAAKPAWKDLIPLLNDPSGNVRWHTTNALWEIDFDAAQKLGLVLPPMSL